ncbi:MAG: hypothetical protein SV375_16065 [Thermodesulfobacteriota bacterium]|nr:hypothetical protein [Thermodesulfobacteriota bacterium]
MPTDVRKPTSAGLSEVLCRLIEAGIDFILVGGPASVIQGAPVTTLDVDIVYSQSPDNIARLLSFLKSVEAVHRCYDDKLIEPKERDLWGKSHDGSAPWIYWLLLRGEGPMRISRGTSWTLISEGTPFECLI